MSADALLPSRRVWLPCALLAATVVLLLYVRTLSYGLYWDDFDLLRPWSWSDLAQAFTGDYRPWTHDDLYFYRPLTSLYFALAFGAFGLNGAALHWIPLVTMTTAATLVGVYASRVTDRMSVGLIATLVYAVHPLTAAAIGPWIANQYQGFTVIVIVLALLAWPEDRASEPKAWWRVVPLLVAAAWLKEDGLFVGPALLGVAAVHGWLAGRSLPSWRLAGGIVATFVALVLWRTWWLPDQLGYGFRESGAMVANLTRAPRYALAWQAASLPPVWPMVLLKWSVLAGAGWLAVKERRGAEFRLVVTGVLLLLVMNLPLALVSSENRWYAIGLGAVLLTVGVLARLRGSLRVVAIVLAVGLFATDAWHRTSNFAPCSADSREYYVEALTYEGLPPQLRQWLAERGEACDRGEYEPFAIPVDQLRWGGPVNEGPETP